MQAKQQIRNFLTGISQHKDRTDWVVQLADGIFHLYSLTIAPEAAANLQKGLGAMTLFFDTNVLFGLLDLHVHPHVEVSKRLVEAIQSSTLKNKFKLRYHECTKQETRSTINYYGDRLRETVWPASFSRSIVARPSNLSGIEMKFHQLNAERGCTPDIFLRKYEYLDDLLRNKGVEVFREESGRTEERALLFADYRAYIDQYYARKKTDKITSEVTRGRREASGRATKRHLWCA